jgi:hypothetical protein
VRAVCAELDPDALDELRADRRAQPAHALESLGTVLDQQPSAGFLGQSQRPTFWTFCPACAAPHAFW